MAHIDHLSKYTVLFIYSEFSLLDCNGFVNNWGTNNLHSSFHIIWSKEKYSLTWWCTGEQCWLLTNVTHNPNIKLKWEANPLHKLITVMCGSHIQRGMSCALEAMYWDQRCRRLASEVPWKPNTQQQHLLEKNHRWLSDFGQSLSSLRQLWVPAL